MIYAVGAHVSDAIWPMYFVTVCRLFENRNQG